MLLLLAAAHAACPAPTRLTELESALGAATVAFDDPATFLADAARAETILPCLADVLPPAAAGAYYRVQGLAAWLRKDTTGAVEAFRSTHTILPGAGLPASVARGSPLHQAWEQARVAGDGPRAPARPPPGLYLTIDGSPGSDLPVQRPVIVQLLAEDDRVLDTRWLPTGSDLPDWSNVSSSPTPLAPEPAPEPVPLPPPPQPPPRASKLPWVASAGAAAIVGGGLYAWALASRAEYDDTSRDLDEDELGAIRQRTNTLVAVSAVAGAATLGLGTVAVLTVDF